MPGPLEKPANPLLFPAHLISKSIQANLPSGYVIRPLSMDDYELGVLEALSHLTTVGEVSQSQFHDRFFYMKAHAHEYFVIVIEDTNKGKIAAAGTLLVERKFIHANGLVGHIEDIVVHKDYRKLQFGRFIIEMLKHIGREVGCYKVILDCAEKNVPFYEKCDFKVKGFEMAWYVEKAKL